MNYPTHDTEWAESQLGNHWRRVNGIPLIVGKHRGSNYFWASIDHVFLDGVFTSAKDAMSFTDEEFERREKEWEPPHDY